MYKFFLIEPLSRDSALLQAVWFTETEGKLGPVFGGQDQWKGMGLFLDSYDNDGQVTCQFNVCFDNQNSSILFMQKFKFCVHK